MHQVEGRKRWRVYPPFENDELPRTSSRNYHPKEVTQKEEIYEILNPGDVLYVPRGWIHQGFYLTKFLVFLFLTSLNMREQTPPPHFQNGCKNYFTSKLVSRSYLRSEVF